MLLLLNFWISWIKSIYFILQQLAEPRAGNVFFSKYGRFWWFKSGPAVKHIFLPHFFSVGNDIIYVGNTLIIAYEWCKFFDEILTCWDPNSVHSWSWPNLECCECLSLLPPQMWIPICHENLLRIASKLITLVISSATSFTKVRSSIWRILL